MVHDGNQDEMTGSRNRQAAITELYQRYASPLLLYLRRHTASIEDAEDLLLDTFQAALLQEHLLERPEALQRMWLWRVARNKLVDAHRRRQRHPAAALAEHLLEELVDNEAIPEQRVLWQEENERLHRALQHLSPLQQKMLMLRFVQNQRCAEIGKALGKSEKAIRALLARTLNHLRMTYRSREEMTTDAQSR